MSEPCPGIAASGMVGQDVSNTFVDRPDQACMLRAWIERKCCLMWAQAFSTDSDRGNTPEDARRLFREAGSTRPLRRTLCGLRMCQPPPLRRHGARDSKGVRQRSLGTSVATSLARRVEIAEAHRIQSPRYRSRSSRTASCRQRSTMQLSSSAKGIKRRRR